MSAPRGIDWDSQLLGEVPDVELASSLGVDRSAVAGARKRRGIPRCPDCRWVEVDWDSAGLGESPDVAVAARLGCSEARVRVERVRRHIPAWRFRPRDEPQRAWRWVDWEAYPIGERPDGEVAAMAGVGRAAASRARRTRGLPVPTLRVTCPCGREFEAQRAFAVYCSETCAQAVSTHRHHGRPSETEPLVAALARFRSDVRRLSCGR